MPGGLTDMPGGMSLRRFLVRADMPGGLTDMPGGLTDMPGGLTDMPGGMSLRLALVLWIPWLRGSGVNYGIERRLRLPFTVEQERIVGTPKDRPVVLP